MPDQVVFALILLDLPFDLDDKKRSNALKKGYGHNWIYIISSCGERYIHLVDKIFSLCSYHQIRELCFLKDDKITDCPSAISLATVSIKDTMRKALRFVGR